jgi:hypothetical protein
VSRNPKHEDLAGHNGFGNPFSGAQWVHFVNFSYKVQQLLPRQNYMDFFNIPQTVPKVTLPEPDTGQLIEDNAARIERELQLLHTDPGALIGRSYHRYRFSSL